ncbi:MAG: tetratricopeptide repeat protein [Treponemataceae bacterium]|nr:tetratricopeptide repeat protein [Treponemataceae bacterium]
MVNDEVRQGQNALNSGSIDSALSHFEKAALALPISDGEPAFSAGTYSEMASLLHEAAQNAADAGSKARLGEAAVRYAKEAVKNDPGSAPAHYILGKYAMDGRDYQSALEHFTAAVNGDTSEPKNSLYYYDLGRVQYTLKKYTEAKHSFTTAAQLGAGFAQAHYNLALTDLRLNDQKAALAEFRKAHDIDPRYEKAYLEEGRLLSKLGDFSGAIAAYQNVVKLNNVNRAALQELGSVYSQAGRLQEAEQTFRQSLALVPAGTDDPLTHYNLSAVLFEEGRPEEAVGYAKKAYDASSQLKDSASKVNVVYNYALLCEATGDVDTAVEKYGEVLAQNALHLKTLINLGAIYMDMTPPDTENALALLLMAYNQDSGNFEVNNNLGSAYLEKKDFKNAALYFQNALKIDAKSTEMRMNLAKAFAGNGQYDDARTVYLELLKLDPSNWDAYVELGKVCMALKNDADAEKYLVYVQAKSPSHRTEEVESLLASISAGAAGAE